MAELESNEFMDFISNMMKMTEDNSNIQNEVEICMELANKLKKQKEDYERRKDEIKQKNNNYEEYAKVMKNMRQEYMNMADNKKNENQKKQGNNNNGTVNSAVKKQISKEEVEKAMNKNKVELLNEGRTIHVVCEEDYQNDYDGLDVLIKKSTIESVQIEYTTVTITTTSGNEFYAAYDSIGEAKRFYNMIMKML